jgi:hypothetical protein
MFVVTTAMFALGLTALALDTTLAFQRFARELSPFSAPGSASSSPSWSVRRANIVTAVGATIACTIVSAPFTVPVPFLSMSLLFFLYFFLSSDVELTSPQPLLPITSMFSATSSARGGRPCCGITIGGSSRFSPSSSSERPVSCTFFCGPSTG